VPHLREEVRIVGATVVYFSERESSDELACAKRLTGRKLVGAWGLVGLLFAGLAVASFAECGLQRLVSHLPMTVATQTSSETAVPEEFC
jgi:hypothetical protein